MSSIRRHWKAVASAAVGSLFLLIWANPDVIFGRPRLLLLLQTLSGNWSPPQLPAHASELADKHGHSFFAALAILLNFGTLVALGTTAYKLVSYLSSLKTIERNRTVNIASLYKIRDARIKAEVIQLVARPYIPEDQLAAADMAIDNAIKQADDAWTESTLSRFMDPNEVKKFKEVIMGNDFEEKSE